LAVDAEYHRGQTFKIQVWSETGEPIPIEPDILFDQGLGPLSRQSPS
jgi:hypothetical protein